MLPDHSQTLMAHFLGKAGSSENVFKKTLTVHGPENRFRWKVIQMKKSTERVKMNDYLFDDINVEEDESDEEMYLPPGV